MTFTRKVIWWILFTFWWKRIRLQITYGDVIYERCIPVVQYPAAGQEFIVGNNRVFEIKQVYYGVRWMSPIYIVFIEQHPGYYKMFPKDFEARGFKLAVPHEAT